MNKIIAFVMTAIIMLTAVAFAEELPMVEDNMIIPASATTGVETDKQDTVLVVQIDNEPAARPQLGLSYADIVYEMPVYNGGYTRYTAVFNDTIPETVEAVRSARILNADIALDHGGAFVHFGGQEYEGTSVYDYFKTANIQARYDGLHGTPSFFYRDKKREAPNNVVGKLAEIASDVDWEAVECKSPMKFSADAWTGKGESAVKFGVEYRSGYSPAYEYVDGVYYRSYNGKPHVDGMNDVQLSCANVIVRQMEYSWYEGASDRPVIESVGSGKCEYFIGGMHFTGYWERASLDDTTVYYDDEGNEVVFRTGKTFVQIISDEEEVAIAE